MFELNPSPLTQILIMKTSLLTLTMLAATFTLSQADTTIMLADFETSSGYPAASPSNAVPIVGYDGWIKISGDSSKGVITPDVGASGYTYVLAGSQSVMGGDVWLWQSFSSQSVTASDIANGTISWLQGSPGLLSTGVNTGAWIGTSGGSILAGIEGRGESGVHSIYLWGKDGDTNTGVTYQYGGGGTPTLDYVYQFSMTFNFTTHTMSGYYSLNGGSNTLLGTVDIGSSLTAADFATNGGILFKGSGSTGFDNFKIDVVPEPTILGLLALGGAAVLLVTRKRQA